jgi:drug/metabolite transporter (DMT)-like permease
VILAVIPGALGWTHSPHVPGTKDDADFYFLIQTSLMQLLGLLTLTLPLLVRLRHPSQPWYWTWFFVGASFACSVAATVLYLYIPTEWSFTVSFLASAAQVFVILQTVFLVDRPPPPRAAKDK